MEHNYDFDRADSAQLRRLKREAQEARKATGINDVQVYTIDTISSDYTTWHVTIIPPQTSLYHGGKFKLVLEYPSDYPIKPPKIRFETKIFHPNVDDESGHALLCETSTEWCPVYTGNSLLRSIIADIDRPQLSTWKMGDAPVGEEAGMQEVNLVGNWHAAELWLQDRDAFETRVAEWLVMYAVDGGEDDGFVLV